MKKIAILGLTFCAITVSMTCANAAKLVNFNNIGNSSGQIPTASQVIPVQNTSNQPINAICKLNTNLVSGKIIVKGFAQPHTTLAFSPSVKQFNATIASGSTISYAIDPNAPLQTSSNKPLKLVCSPVKNSVTR